MDAYIIVNVHVTDTVGNGVEMKINGLSIPFGQTNANSNVNMIVSLSSNVSIAINPMVIPRPTQKTATIAHKSDTEYISNGGLATPHDEQYISRLPPSGHYEVECRQVQVETEPHTHR